MEKNNLNNKLEKDSKEQFKKLNIGLTSLSGFFNGALNESYGSIDSALDKKKAAQAKAYLNKYLKLVSEGKVDAAEELKKTYLEQF